MADGSSPVNLRPIKSTAFKREERRKRKERKKQEKLAESLALWDPLSSGQSRPSDDPNPPISDTPWPCEPSPPENPGLTGWAPFVMLAAPKDAPALSDDCSGNCNNVQANAIRKCKEFFEKEEEENDGCMDEEIEENDGIVSEFFSVLFQNNVDLKRFYEEKKEKGELVCLVCEKRFVGYMGLVQHANTVTKTKRRSAHRVYGSTVSRVLGLETDQSQTQAQLVVSTQENASDFEGDLADMDT
ncbi:hypothetical protein LUZ60_001124 [Juncus effusus]|nr:hypothetical protein LUZ60_001124 [Juncus effusus]